LIQTPDAVVIGAGPNGLVAANMLADEGWKVLVLEAQPQPGGAVQSSELIEPHFVNDHCSAFYPLAAASPIIRALRLDRYGLRWRRAPLVLAHPSQTHGCPVLSTDIDETAASLDTYSPGDGDTWRRLYDRWTKVRRPLLRSVFAPFPPLVGSAGLAVRLGPRGLAEFARFSLLPVRRLAEEEFTGEAARQLVAGNALHADLMPEAALSGFYGWLLCCLGQELGFPVPEGGASSLTNALVRRLEDRHGMLRCRSRVDAIVVRSGRAVAVRTSDGTEIDGAPSMIDESCCFTKPRMAWASAVALVCRPPCISSPAGSASMPRFSSARACRSIVPFHSSRAVASR
jgi:phytoene dehydrogenase-like protein